MNSVVVKRLKIKELYSVIKIVRSAFPGWRWLRRIPYVFLSQVFVVKINNKEIVGLIAFFSDKTTIKITLMAIAKDWQNQHLGSKLLETIIAYARAGNKELITSKVRIDNPRAFSLHEKSGFSVRKILKRRILGDVYLLSKNLNNEC